MKKKRVGNEFTNPKGPHLKMNIYRPICIFIEPRLVLIDAVDNILAPLIRQIYIGAL